MKTKERKITIELTLDQARVIEEALDQYSRICCMQFDEWQLWNRIKEAQEDGFKDILIEDEVDLFRNEIELIKTKYIKGYGASWCASNFIKQCYHIKKSISAYFCIEQKKKDSNHSCVHCGGTILTKDQDTITITESV